MEQTTHHLIGEGYSENNKIQSISSYLKRQNDQQDAILSERDTSGATGKESNEIAPGKESNEIAKDGKKEKEEMMEKATAHKVNPVKNFEARGDREVQDPVTLETITIKDADIDDFKDPGTSNEEAKKVLDPNSGSQGPATDAPSLESTRHIAPRASPGNILIRNFPPPVDENSLNTITSSLAMYSYGIMGALAIIWSMVAFGNGFVKFCFRTSLFSSLIFGVYATYGIIGRKIEKELERIRLQMGKDRAEQYSPPTPESTEWLNAFTSTVWPLINPDMFTAVVDMVEDVMQASLPGFVDAVKVNDFTLGKNALRIVSMRALGDRPGDKEYPRQNWIDQGNKEIRKEDEEKSMKQDTEGEAEVDLDQAGDYVNYEISFAYFAPPGTRKVQNSNISLILEFFLGVYDWIHIPIPIFIAVESIVGTIRLRVQLVPQSPFVRNVTFTFCGVPAVEASAIPLTSKLPNVLDLPIISGFVQSAIAAALSAYCAPKSLTMNVAQMLAGDGIKKDTKALGVLKIVIRHATNLSAQDSNGTSDPYIVLSWAKFGKPLFSTRIVTKDLNPVYEQTAFLIVSDDEVAAKEQLSIMLWDSDSATADDLVGRIHVDLVELMTEPNVVKKREDTLMGFEDADAMSGKLTWEVAYYDKAPLKSSLKEAEEVDHSLPVELQDRPELKVETQSVDTKEETDVRRTPPDPAFPSGVLSIIIHQINNLECQNLEGKSGSNREGQAGQDTDNASEASGNFPSAYCEIILNDDMIFKTRVKQYSCNPYYEAGTETFLRDWTNTRLSVVVRDARLRELDPVLGIVDLDLEDLFAHSSQVTKLYALRDGVGFGRVNISILFKSVQVDLPRNLKGWDTGTVCVTSDIRVEPVENSTFDFKEKKLTLSTLEAKQKIPASSANADSNGLIWNVDSHIRLPTYDRYSSALYFDYGGSSLVVGPLGTKVEAFAAVWLQELVDDVPQEIRVPIVTGKNLSTLRQNYLNDQTKKTHEYEIVGWLIATVELDSGLDADHEQYSKTQTARHEFEAYERISGQAEAAVTNSHANDDGVIDKDEARDIAKAHKKALEARGRGKQQFQIVRTARWSKQGIKDRLRNVKDKITGGSDREETVATEAA